MHVCVSTHVHVSRIVVTEFSQNLTTKGFWGKGECIKFWGQKVKGQGRAGVTYVDGGIIVDRVIKTI